MSYFKSEEELAEVIGGFFKRLPDIDFVIKQILEGEDGSLKIECKKPNLGMALHLGERPVGVELGSDIFGTIGLSLDADDFHKLLLGRLKIAAAISQRKLVVRGPLSRLMQSTLLLSLAPYLYPSYLRKEGRKDLIIKDSGMEPKTRKRKGGFVVTAILWFMYAIGYFIGLVGSLTVSGLDVFKLLRRTGPLLVKSTGFLGKLAGSELTFSLVLHSLGQGINRMKRE